MKQRWGELLRFDPAYSPNLTLDNDPFGLAFPPRVALSDANWFECRGEFAARLLSMQSAPKPQTETHAAFDPFRLRGTQAATLQSRQAIVEGQIEPLFNAIPRDALILEIGGSISPRYVKSEYRNVFHLDHCSAEDLRAKYGADPNVAHLVHRIQGTS